MTRAPCFSARSQIDFRSAMMPSIENTPSVAISLKRASRLMQTSFEVGHVVVLVPQALSLAKADAVDDRGVVELVGDDRVVSPQDGLEEAPVGVPARRVENCVFHAQELGDCPFEHFVRFLRATDESDRSHAITPVVERLMGRPHDLGMIRETEIVIGAHVQDIGTALHADVSLLGRREHPLALPEAGRANLVELVQQVFLNRAEHGRHLTRYLGLRIRVNLRSR